MMLLMMAGALYVGNNACEPCHRDIVRSYRETPMAQSSGRVAGDLTPGSFRHAPSSTSYAIDATGAVHVATNSGKTEWRLDYYIGSGVTGRSFLRANEGFLFQAPVTWYSQQARWDVSPGYESDGFSRWSRAVEPECLTCHSSQIRFSPDYQNRYADPPFAQAGVGCERCHGPGSDHIAGKGSLINPVKLDPLKRDSVCSQCHMSGEARVARAGKSFLDYRPGESLSSYVSYFVNGGDSRLKAAGYVERLAASRCKLSSGDRLWCGTCHDPHRIPAAQERAAWFAAKCLSCHLQAECARGPDCAGCHMPKSQVQDVAHGMLTDHGIWKRRPVSGPRAPAEWRLRGFSAADDGIRELGLAYAEVSVRTRDPRQADEAFRLLTTVSEDKEVKLRLAGLYQHRGDLSKASALYQEILSLDPGSIVALVNLGDYYGSHGAVDRAIALWRRALLRNPCQPESAVNLRTAYLSQHDLQSAELLRQSQRHCAAGVP